MSEVRRRTVSIKPARKTRISARYSRLFAATENMIAGFEPREGLEPFRVPSEPKPLDPLIFAFFGEVDPVEVWNDVPMALLDLIIGCGFGGGPGGSSTASTWMLALPSRRHVYVQSTNYNGVHILAATGSLFTNDDTLRFLELLASDKGARFGIGVISSPPEEFSIGVKAPRQKLIDLTYDLFANAGQLESLRDDTEWWSEIPQPPPRIVPDWEENLLREFGPIQGRGGAMAFSQLREAYQKKHRLPEIEWPEAEDADNFSIHEVVELWLQSHDVIEKPRRRRKAVTNRRSR